MTKLYVLSDINVDYVISDNNIVDGKLLVPGKPTMGGAGFNAAIEFQKVGIDVVLLGSLGLDNNSIFATEMILQQKLQNILLASNDKPTGTCNMISSRRYKNTIRLSVNESDNANNLSIDDLELLLSDSGVKLDDYIFITGHFLVRNPIEKSIKYMDIIRNTKARIIFDLVPHNLYELISLADLQTIFHEKLYFLISELGTLRGFLGINGNSYFISDKEKVCFFNAFKANYISVRYGKEQNSIEDVFLRLDTNEIITVRSLKETGFVMLAPTERHGFGDKLTAKLIQNYI